MRTTAEGYVDGDVDISITKMATKILDFAVRRLPHER
jgi:hypothetical protein